MRIETDQGLVSQIDEISLESFQPVYGLSPAMRSMERLIAGIAPTDIPVVLSGESGTGKEVVALELHRRSSRRDEPFFKCRCGTVSAEQLSLHLIPAERNGETSGGTIFLDEVNQLDPPSQSALLQALPDGSQVQRRFTRARVISATTKDLEEEMREGRFRRELYYRLNGVCLRLPPLRERKEDIPVLLDAFLKKYASLFSLREPKLSSVTADLLLQHSWPGNVRELENFARKFVALRNEQLALSDLAPGRWGASQNPTKQVSVLSGHRIQSLKEASREASRRAERELILEVLQRTRWNRKQAARELQISYKAMLYKLKYLGLDSDNKACGPLEQS